MEVFIYGEIKEGIRVLKDNIGNFDRRHYDRWPDWRNFREGQVPLGNFR